MVPVVILGFKLIDLIVSNNLKSNSADLFLSHPGYNRAAFGMWMFDFHIFVGLKQIS